MANAKKSKTTLEDFELGYEELKKAKKTKSKPKKNIVGSSSSYELSNSLRRVLSKPKGLSVPYRAVVNKIKRPRKKTKRVTKNDLKLAKEQRNRAILGIGQLLVVVSIAYSTSVIFIGIDSLSSKIALFPQVVFALVTLIKAFSKLYK